MTLLVTGGAGFIGSAVVRRAVAEGRRVVTLDALTYAANPANLDGVADSGLHVFEHADIRDRGALARIFEDHSPDAVMHLAAESHVDRSIDGPAAFVDTNVNGTFALLEAALAHWRRLPEPRRGAFRFHHVSTDEVYGALGPTGRFTEESPYRPNSPYSASKAASDHLARAWGETYGLPVIVTNCSNNYGPRQFPEKLIPNTILKAASGSPIPVYGRGENVRDWLHVDDHAEALLLALDRGAPGRTYLIGGDAERANIEVVRAVCAAFDALRPAAAPHERLIAFVADRPGHDFRYAIDAARIRDELGWRPARRFEDGLRETVRWFLDNADWWTPLLDRTGRRLGLGAAAE